MLPQELLETPVVTVETKVLVALLEKANQLAFDLSRGRQIGADQPTRLAILVQDVICNCRVVSKEAR